MECVCSSEIPPDADLPEVVEGVVCQSDKGVEGQMKEEGMDGYKILSIREKWGAQGPKCLMYSLWSSFD